LESRLSKRDYLVASIALPPTFNKIFAIAPKI